MKTFLITSYIATVVAYIIMSYIAGCSYDKGYIEGYDAAYKKDEAYLDSFLIRGRKIVFERDRAIALCDDLQELYFQKLDSINSLN